MGAALVAAILPLIAVAAPPTEGSAQRALRAQVVLTQTPIPRRLEEEELWKHAVAARAQRFRETKEPDLERRSWKITVVARFNRRPDDFEIQLLFYDIHAGRRFVESQTMMTGLGDRHTFRKTLKLRRPLFHPNRRHEMVVTVRRQEVAKSRFLIAGDNPRQNQVLTFSPAEATDR